MHEPSSSSLSFSLPLDMAFDLVDEPVHARARVIVTCRQHPGLVGLGADPVEAVTALLVEISDEQPLTASMVEELTDSGYDEEVLGAWERHVRGFPAGELRHEEGRALRTLRDYTEQGIPPAVACEFIGLGLDPYASSQVWAGGRFPVEARPYVTRLGDFVSLDWGDVGFRAFAINGNEIADWACSSFDPEEASFYERAGLNPAEAEDWSDIVQEHTMSWQDLRTIIDAGFSPQDVRKEVARTNDQAKGVVQAAKMIVSLR